MPPSDRHAFALPTAALSTQPSASVRLARLELLALCAFAFVLPLFEAPKNLLWIVYVGLWIASHARSRDFGGRWQTWDTLIVLWVVSGYVSAIFAGLHHAEWTSALDILRYGSVLWVLRRTHYGAAAMQRLLVCIVLGTLTALLWGYYELRITGGHKTLGLNSVGHVNHSAIYLVIVFGTVLAWVRGAWSADRVAKRLLGATLCVALGVSLVVMASGGALGATLIAGLALLVTFALRSRKQVWPFFAAAFVIVAVIFAARPEVVEKNALRISEHQVLSFRDGIWRAALHASREYPLFGVGMGNYSRIDSERLAEWSRARGETLDAKRIWPSAHAHSLYLNTLAERGVAGLTVLLAILAAWAWLLARGIPQATESPLRWAYWGGALTAWLVAIIVGLVNTTLHHEHALLSMLLLGGWFSLSRSPSMQSSVCA
ncbi:MAG: O-antigen ligase family protein [Betaproteobacteria bacterium]|nr:O-antigen ligase family protein [Betaproteobacteria bacterium]